MRSLCSCAMSFMCKNLSSFSQGTLTTLPRHLKLRVRNIEGEAGPQPYRPLVTHISFTSCELCSGRKKSRQWNMSSTLRVCSSLFDSKSASAELCAAASCRKQAELPNEVKAKDLTGYFKVLYLLLAICGPHNRPEEVDMSCCKDYPSEHCFCPS